MDRVVYHPTRWQQYYDRRDLGPELAVVTSVDPRNWNQKRVLLVDLDRIEHDARHIPNVNSIDIMQHLELASDWTDLKERWRKYMNDDASIEPVQAAEFVDTLVTITRDIGTVYWIKQHFLNTGGMLFDLSGTPLTSAHVTLLKFPV